MSPQAKKGEKSVSMMPAFDLMGDDIVELSIENESLKNEIGSCYESWLEETTGKFLKQINGEKTPKLIMSRMEKQMKKQK